MAHNDLMEKLISLAKRRGFIYQGSEIYGGLAGTWDYGPLGVELKNNIKKSFWKRFVQERRDMYGLDASILMQAGVWESSGHVGGFADPMVECSNCKSRYRADQLAENIDENTECPSCKKKGTFGEARQFNMMFSTRIGAAEDTSAVSYLRPETAQGIFVNFKNILDSFHPKLPFGIAQIGKAFRNEITPRDFLFRVREFEQMEIEYFVRENEWKGYFEEWRAKTLEWVRDIGIPEVLVHELEVPEEDLAHYSKRTIDVEFDFPFGRKELFGLAYRTDFDLRAHQEGSGVSLEYFDQENNERFIPHVIEPSFGLDRIVLALLLSSYYEEEVEGENRAVLRLPPDIAPVKVAVLPLMKKDGLSEKASEVWKLLSSEWSALFDETGSIGKRYRRQDEIGTPFCITVDYDTLEDDTVTVRERDSLEQVRAPVSELVSFFTSKLR